NNETEEVVFENTFDGETFSENIPFEVVSIEIDPHSDLISGNNTAVFGTESFAFSELKVYPNPVREKLLLKKPTGLKINSYEIHNLLGETLQASADFQAGFIPVNKLETGVYFIALHTSQGDFVRKFIKK